MVLRPSGIVFVNNDLTDNVRAHLVKQLHINEVLDGYVFDDRVASDPEYLNRIRQFQLRVMVVRSFEELENRQLADVVIFVSHGLAAILENNFGPHGQTYAVLDLTWPQLCVF